MRRIEFLDGLRGVAIVLVICYHAFSRWPLLVPYGNTYGDFAFFKYGYLGVQLFFLISGFVILMSLEKNKNFLTFIYKRWLRLFPAMLVATVLIYLTANFLYERPAGLPHIKSIVPGLLLMEPKWIKTITGIAIPSIEGAFWSLYVEVEFYFIFGLSFFLLGKEKAIAVIFSMFLISVIGLEFNIDFFNRLSDYFSFNYFGWFASGALAYLYFIHEKNKYLYFSMLAGVLQVYQYRTDLTLVFVSICILLVFFLPVYFKGFRSLLSNRTILFLGFISYPLYLIHENAMIALICKISKIVDMPHVLLPVIPIGMLVVISYFIAKVLEPFIRKVIIQIGHSLSAVRRDE